MGYLKRLSLLAAISASLFVFAPEARAQSSSSLMNVQINVTPYLSNSVTNTVPSVTVTQADINAGYKDYPAATTVTTSTNSTNGYVLSVALMDLTSGSLQVYTSGTATVDSVNYPLSPGTFTNVNFPYNGAQTQTKVLSYRLNLNPGISPGTYSWPISITASPY